jgi:hypothetical protein
MVKSTKQAPAPAPPLPPWQRLHKPVVPAKTAEEVESEKVTDAPEEAAAKAPPEAAAGVPTDHPSNEPNQKKSSGVTHPPSKKSRGYTSDSDSDDEPIFKDFKAVKCPRTSVSAEAYAKRLREKEEAEKEGKKRGGNKAAAAKNNDGDASSPILPRRGKRDRGNGGSKINDASADDIDALAITVAESSESPVAKKSPKPKTKKKPAKAKAPPEKKSAPSAAKASKKTDAKPAAKKPPAAAKAAASTTTATKRSSTRGKALPEGNALEHGLDPSSSSPQRSSGRQRTQVVPFTITDAPASSAVHGEHTTEEQVAPAKKSSKEPKKRKAAEPPPATANKAKKVTKKDHVESKKRKTAEPTEPPAAATKAKKVAKKDAAPKKAPVAEEDDEDEAYLPPISPRAQHVTAKMEATWNERMKMLREHKAKYGTTDLTVAEKGEVNQLLRSFVFEQRKQHKKYMSGKHSSLSAERIKELTDMGFEFDPMSSGTHKVNSMRRFNQQWDEMYDELVQFKNVHGNTLVPLGKKAKEEVSRC